MKWLFEFFLSEHPMGLRIVKTGIAVTVCVVISVLIHLNQPFIAVAATVMSMGKSIDMSVKSGKDKMVGALIGVIFGGLFAMFSPGNAGLSGIGIIFVLYLCQFFGLRGAGALSSLVFASIMFTKGNAPAWIYAFHCAEGALIGIAVAILINLVILPPNYVDEIKTAFEKLKELTQMALEDAAGRRQIDVRAIDAILEKLSRNMKLYVSEAKIFRWNDDEIFEISCTVAVYRMIFDELKAVEIMDLSDTKEPDGELLTVYRYHVKRMRELYESTLDKNNGAG